MIASVSGRVAALAPDGVVVEVGGVGLSVQCTPATIARLRVGEPATLPTTLVVREDSLTLYGFVDADEKALFELLQTASGVGPRLAQAVLAVHRPVEVRRAVATEDLAALVLVPGIGRKGAQRLVLELKDRIGGPEEIASAGTGLSSAPGPEPTAWREQVRDALVGLGYSAREVEESLATVDAAPDPTGAVDVAVVLRASLRALGRG